MKGANKHLGGTFGAIWIQRSELKDAGTLNVRKTVPSYALFRRRMLDSMFRAIRRRLQDPIMVELWGMGLTGEEKDFTQEE